MKTFVKISLVFSLLISSSCSESIDNDVLEKLSSLKTVYIKEQLINQNDYNGKSDIIIINMENCKEYKLYGNCKVISKIKYSQKSDQIYFITESLTTAKLNIIDCADKKILSFELPKIRTFSSEIIYEVLNNQEILFGYKNKLITYDYLNNKELKVVELPETQITDISKSSDNEILVVEVMIYKDKPPFSHKIQVHTGEDYSKIVTIFENIQFDGFGSNNSLFLSTSDSSFVYDSQRNMTTPLNKILSDSLQIITLQCIDEFNYYAFCNSKFYSPVYQRKTLGYQKFVKIDLQDSLIFEEICQNEEHYNGVFRIK